MFGYVIGTLCLLGLIWTLRGGGGRHCGGRRRWRGRGGCGGGGWHRHGGDWHRHGGEGDGPGEGGGDWGYRDAPPWARGGGEGGGGPWARRGWGWGFRGVEGAVFRRLNATPEQERALGETFDALRSALRAAREAAGRARGDLATALRQEQVDAAKLGDFIARFDASTAGVREALTSALFKAHEVLDERQRRELADLLEGGFFRRGGGGPGPWGGRGEGGGGPWGGRGGGGEPWGGRGGEGRGPWGGRGGEGRGPWGGRGGAGEGRGPEGTGGGQGPEGAAEGGAS
ncbi:MAG TPA: periplasmic heavy metal sensor [Polyangiaceae bacterium]|nr:periplasmic heavy metal sensor [Polyangiaceae bacterium]